MSGEVLLKRRTIPERLRYCAAQLGNPGRGEHVDIRVARILETAAAELDALAVAPKFPPLEVEALRWLATGRARDEIAEAMGVGRGWVDTYLRRAFCRLGVRTALEAVAAADRLGLLPVERAS